MAEIDGLIGQYGKESLRRNAVQAIAGHSSSWHQARATRGRARPRPSTEPRLLPMPMPVRNTARMSENVYVVAPNSSDRVRVQRTSAASAVSPDSPMAMYTAHRSRTRDRSPGATADGSYAVLSATRSARPATVTFSATATYVVTAISVTRSR